MFCEKCGTTGGNGAKFCSSCGGALNASAALWAPSAPTAGTKTKRVNVNGITTGGRAKIAERLKAKYEKKGWLFGRYEDGGMGKAFLEFEVPPAAQQSLRALAATVFVMSPLLFLGASLLTVLNFSMPWVGIFVVVALSTTWVVGGVFKGAPGALVSLANAASRWPRYTVAALGVASPGAYRRSSRLGAQVEHRYA